MGIEMDTQDNSNLSRPHKNNFEIFLDYLFRAC
jgi:hypothetical protein